MYLMAQDAMRAQDYRHYEISNWARPGFESLHNLAYWRNQAYLGVGPGAHSYLAPHRFFNLKSPREYVKRLQHSPQTLLHTENVSLESIKSVPVVEDVEVIGHRLQMAETLMMGLRLDTGIEVTEFARRFGGAPAQFYGETIKELATLDLLETVDGWLRLTTNGRIFGNEVFSRFFD